MYPGDVPFSVTRVKTVHKDGVNLSQMEIGSHNGTHIDVPAHLFDGGMVTEGFPLDHLVGPAWVADCTDVTEGEAITLDRLNALGIEGSPERILFKTRNSNLWKRDNFQMRYVYLGVDAARALAERGVKAVGIDYLSVDRYGAPELETHVVLMGAGTIIIENVFYLPGLGRLIFQAISTTRSEYAASSKRFACSYGSLLRSYSSH